MTLMVHTQQKPKAEAAAHAIEAVVFEEPRSLSLRTVQATAPGSEDVRIRTLFSGISTGTERLLYEGRMPQFPGLAYPLVPGYETVGEVVWAGSDTNLEPGARVFVPGAACYSDVRALFGGAGSELVTAAKRVVPLPATIANANALLLSLAATAEHILALAPQPDLIVGHGVLGRLLARLCVLRGNACPVWELKPERRAGAVGYPVFDPAADDRRGLHCIVDVSGDSSILDSLIPLLAPRGEVVLGGFYAEPLNFAFPAAFMREASIRVAAEFSPEDLATVLGLLERNELHLDGLLTHQLPVADAAQAYAMAFADPDCLKMVLTWEEIG